jgi:cobyrinic acid a,c-diamide synthase
MAKLLKAPVVLVIDTRGVSRGVAPLLLGYQHFDKDLTIAGVIYNFCSGARHEQKLRAVTEEYTDIPVFGMLRKSTTMDLAERHLGLMPSNETKDAKQRISEIAQFVTGSVDLSKVLNCADSASVLAVSEQPLIVNTHFKNKVRIGICEDAAFGFYYADDKQALINTGADLISINTLDDSKLPEDLDGLFIGGGFPETQMKALEANTSMRESIHAAIEAGLPTYAECGGLMYLSESIHWKNESAKMVGVIPANAQMNKKPQGRGHVILEETSNMPWGKYSTCEKNLKNDSSFQSTPIKAHEFHYSSLQSTNDSLNAKGKFAFKVKRGVGINGDHDGWVYKNLIASYSHIRHTSAYPWADRFIEFIRVKRDTRDITTYELENMPNTTEVQL